MQNRRRLHADGREQPAADGLQQHREDQAPAADDRLARGIPPAGMRACLDASGEHERAERKSAEERGHHGEHGSGFVPEPDGALLRPDDLIAEPCEARCRHQGEREPPPGALRHLLSH